MYDFVFGAPLPSKAESHDSASAFDSCGEYLRTTRPGSAETSVCFRMASDQTPHSIIQPPVARTSSDTQRFCAYKGHPDGPTLSLKTCMPGGSSTWGIPSRKSRTRRSEFGPRGWGSSPWHVPTRPTQTQTTTWFRHAARAWTRSGLAWVLRPPRTMVTADPIGVPSWGRDTPPRQNPCRVRGSPGRGSLDDPGKHSRRSASLGCMMQAWWACRTALHLLLLAPCSISSGSASHQRFTSGWPSQVENSGSLPPPTAETTAPAQRRPTPSG